MIDIHAHILPGIDNGPGSWNDSLKLARYAVQDGIEVVVATPHHCYGNKVNSREKVHSAVSEIQKLLSEHGIALTVMPGAEVAASACRSGSEPGTKISTINDTGRYVLLQMPEDRIPQWMEEAVLDLVHHQITPIISHPERNRAVTEDPNTVTGLINAGALIQVNACSLTGKSGFKVMKTAEILVLHNMVHFVASDMHSFETRAPEMAGARRKVERLLGGNLAQRLVQDNPGQVIRGESIEGGQPLKYRKLVGMFRHTGQALFQQIKRYHI